MIPQELPSLPMPEPAGDPPLPSHGREGRLPRAARRAPCIALIATVLVLGLDGLAVRAQMPGYEPLPEDRLYRIEFRGPAGTLRQARDISRGPGDSIFVLDAGNGRVQWLDDQGAVIGVWGRAGTRDGELLEPVALSHREAAEGGGEVLVLEAGGWVERFDLQGAHLGRWLLSRPEGRARGEPRDLAVDAEGRVYLLEDRRLHAYEADGSPRWWSADSSDDLDALWPLADGRVVALAGGDAEALVFGSEGQLETRWSTIGQPAESPSRPVDLREAADGSLLLAYELRGEIQRFSPDGTWQATLPAEGVETLRSFSLLSDGRIALLSADDGLGLHAAEDGAPLRDLAGPDPDGPRAASQLRFAPDGSLLLIDPEMARILRLDAEGRLLGRIDGGSVLSLLRPMQLAFEPEGDFWVSDGDAGRLYRFSAEGRPRGSLIDAEGETLAFNAPRGVAVDARGQIYVADSELGQRIQVLGPDGSIRASWRRAGPSGDPLRGLQGLALGARGGLFALDHHASYYRSSASIYRFSEEGEAEARFGPHGQASGALRHPTDLTALPDGSLLVADRENARLQRFDAWGGFLEGRDLPSDFRPVSADRSADGRIYAVDDRGRIEVFGEVPAGVWRVEHFDGAWLAGWPSPSRHLQPAEGIALDLDADSAAMPPVGGSARYTLPERIAGVGHELDLDVEGDLGLRLWVGSHLLVDALGTRAADQRIRFDLQGSRSVELELRRGDPDAALHLSLRPLAVPMPTAEPTRRPLPSTAPTGRPGPSSTPMPTLPSPLYLPITRVGAADPGPIRTPEPAFLAHPEIDVLDYDVELWIPELGGGIRARTVVTLELRAERSSIDLDLEPRGLRVHGVQVDGRPAVFGFSGGRLRSGISGQVLRTQLGGPVAAGRQVALTVDYTILAGHAFDTETWYYGAGLMSNVGWPYNNRRWLPSNDHPADPARARFTLRVPAEFMAAANGVLEAGDLATGEGLDAEGLRVFRWRLDQPTPSYNLHVVVGKLDVHRWPVCFDTDGSEGQLSDALTDCDRAEHRLSLLLYHPAGVELDAGTIESMNELVRATAFFSRLFGVYPYDKLAFVLEPHPFSMEYAGLVALRNNGSAVHELVHHWWGNPLWIEDWGDFWISEGFTTYFTAFFDEYQFDQPPVSPALPPGRLAHPPGTDPYSLFDRVPYDRGAAALADLRARLGRAAGLDPAGPETRMLFVDLMRALQARYESRHLGVDGLLDFLHTELPPRSQAAGHPIAVDVADRMVSDWQWAWLTWQEAEAHVHGSEGTESHPMVPGIIGPSLADLGQLGGDLAWYGEACNTSDGQRPEPAQPVAGKVALIARGVCSFVEKMDNAQAMGAEAVLMYTDDRETVAIQGPIEDLRIPGGMIDQAPGESIRARLEAGEALSVTLEVRSFDHDDRPLRPRGP